MSEPSFTPVGAPLRPGQPSFVLVAFLAAVCALVGFFFCAYSVFGAIGFLGVGVVLIAPVMQRRHFDRIGWYERREVAVPSLPFEMRGEGQRIIFGIQSITFSGFLARERTLNYAQIVGVQTDCEGHCLEGVTIQATNETDFNALAEPQHILDSGDGERTRISLATLRARAPHTIFSGPKWVEEGWVPRLGFSHPTGSGA